VLEVILCQYENGTIFYQFNGMGGRPCQPHEVQRLLMTIATGLTQPTDGVVAPTVVPEPHPHLFPEETLA
jgi:hypothetical protein